MINRIVYLGSMQAPEDCAQNSWASEAMNVTQLTLMEAFLACGVQEVIGLSLPSTSAWHPRRWLMPRKHQLLQPHLEITELPFLSLGPLQPISQMVSVAHDLVRMMSGNRPHLILITNPMNRLSLPATVAGRLCHIPVVIIVSDLAPISTTHNLFTLARQFLQHKVVKSVPGIVVFSNHVGRELRQDRPWIRMVRPPSADVMAIPQSKPNRDTKNIYFAGTTAHVSGTDLFLNAIASIRDPEYRFWFSGRGPLDDTIREAAHLDNRITHWGFVSRDQYRDLLQKSNVLVNPRPTTLPENRYNFPSKLMEYMAAGRPIISTVTSDVGEFYSDALVLLKNETPQGLADAIIETCNLPYETQVELGQRARQHIDEESWEIQAQRILDFAEKLSPQ